MRASYGQQEMKTLAKETWFRSFSCFFLQSSHQKIDGFMPGDHNYHDQFENNHMVLLISSIS